MSDILSAAETTIKNHLHTTSCRAFFVPGGDNTPQQMNWWNYFSNGANEGEEIVNVTGFKNYLQLSWVAKYVSTFAQHYLSAFFNETKWIVNNLPHCFKMCQKPFLFTVSFKSQWFKFRLSVVAKWSEMIYLSLTYILSTWNRLHMYNIHNHCQNIFNNNFS